MREIIKEEGGINGSEKREECILSFSFLSLVSFGINNNTLEVP